MAQWQVGVHLLDHAVMRGAGADDRLQPVGPAPVAAKHKSVATMHSAINLHISPGYEASRRVR